MRKSSQRLFNAFIICVISGSLFLYIASVVGNGSIEHFDTPIISFVQGIEVSWLTVVLKTFTWIGSGYVVATATIIAFGLLYFVYHQRGQAFLFVTVMITTISSNELLKLYFKRERPEIYRIIDANGLSFPSGHTMMAFSLYTILAYVLWRALKTTRNHILIILFTIFMIMMIAVSRIYLGVHYPSDIAGGLAASLFLVTTMITVFEVIQNRRK